MFDNVEDAQKEIDRLIPFESQVTSLTTNLETLTTERDSLVGTVNEQKAASEVLTSKYGEMETQVNGYKETHVPKTELEAVSTEFTNMLKESLVNNNIKAEMLEGKSNAELKAMSMAVSSITNKTSQPVIRSNGIGVGSDGTPVTAGALTAREQAHKEIERLKQGK